jgi:ribose 5-phosphate isomerase B
MEDRVIAEVVRRVLREIEGPGTARAALPAAWPPVRVALGSDHGGVEMKDDLAAFLRMKKFTVVDCGTRGPGSVDYPDFAAKVGIEVRDGCCEAGIVVDTVGIGSSMAANKIAGVRCALCHDIPTVLNSRKHNDANVLSLGAKVVAPALARRMVALWLATECEGERHLKRVAKIMELEA